MTEMVYGAVPSRVREPILPRWWRTIDKWSLSAILVLFVVGDNLRKGAALNAVQVAEEWMKRHG